MGDAVVVGGDTFTVDPSFGDATVAGKLTSNMIAVGSLSRVKIQGKPVCVQGDESVSIFLPGLTYTAGSFASPPGTGLARNMSLAADQIAKRVSVNGKKVVLKGSQFKATFQGMSPAMDSSSGAPVPDPMVATPRPGQGTINATEQRVKAV
jgi:uncharacterized Zn-binding protein involved in type VI secretion